MKVSVENLYYVFFFFVFVFASNGDSPVYRCIPFTGAINKIAVFLGDNCIQIFHLGRYIVGYTVGNFVLRRRVSGAVKHDFRPYI